MVNGQTEPIRDSSMDMNKAPSLFTGDAIYGRTDTSENGQLTITDTSPFPVMVQAIFGMIEVGDI
jgi:hypothetical protein